MKAIEKVQILASVILEVAEWRPALVEKMKTCFLREMGL